MNGLRKKYGTFNFNYKKLSLNTKFFDIERKNIINIVKKGRIEKKSMKMTQEKFTEHFTI